MSHLAATRFSYDDVYQNLALEEILLQKVADGSLPPLVRLWHNPESVIMGISRSIEKDLHLENIEKELIPLARRISGGGTVYHDNGTISISFIFPWKFLGFDDDPRTVDESTIKPFLDLIIGLVGTFGLVGYHKGISDVFIGDRKISGNAQKRVRRAILHHGTILLNVNLNKMSRYLKIPPERTGVPHDEFVTSLENLGVESSEDQVYINLLNYLMGEFDENVSEMDLSIHEPGLSHEVSKLADKNYRIRDWIFRKP